MSLRTVAALGAGFFGLTLAASAAHNFGDETIAFFPFNDGAAGTSAAGVTLKNAIDDYSSLTGRVVVTGNGAATFSDEAPGEYVFTNLAYVANDQWNYRHPKSLYFTSDSANTANRAEVFFDDLVKEAQKLGAYKIEFWYKLDTNATSGWEPGFFRIYGGWNKMSGDTVVATNGVLAFMITGMGSATTQPQVYNQIAWSPVDGSAEQKSNGSYKQPPVGSLKDGKWHYVAFTTPSIRENGTLDGFGFCQDGYANADDMPAYFVEGPADAARPMVLNTSGKFRGWISCVRLSRKAISQSKYANPQQDIVRPSSLPTCVPRAYVRYRFDDQTAGEPLTSVVTNLSSYNSYNPNIYFLPRNYLLDWRRAGRDPGHGEVIAYNAEAELTAPTAVADVKKRFVYEEEGSSTRLPNALSGKFVSPAVTNTWAVGYGILTRVGTYLQPDQEPQTVEMFYKFDYEGWKARVGTNACRQVSLMWITQDRLLTADDQYLETFGIGMDLKNEKRPQIGIRGWMGTLVGVESQKVVDGRWHHVAATIEKKDTEHATCNFYLDGEKLLENQTMPVFFNRGNPGCSWYVDKNCDYGRNLWFARSDKSLPTQHNTANANGFHGEIDEIRVSWGVLDPSEFMCQKNDTGLSILLR